MFLLDVFDGFMFLTRRNDKHVALKMRRIKLSCAFLLMVKQFNLKYARAPDPLDWLRTTFINIVRRTDSVAGETTEDANGTQRASNVEVPQSLRRRRWDVPGWEVQSPKWDRQVRLMVKLFNTLQYAAVVNKLSLKGYNLNQNIMLLILYQVYGSIRALLRVYGGCTLLPTILWGTFFSKYFPLNCDWSKTPPTGPLLGPKEGP